MLLEAITQVQSTDTANRLTHAHCYFRIGYYCVFTAYDKIQLTHLLFCRDTVIVFATDSLIVHNCSCRQSH